MEPSDSVDATNPDLVTKFLCTLIEWPKKSPDKECLHPDPDPPKPKDPKEVQPPSK